MIEIVVTAVVALMIGLLIGILVMRNGKLKLMMESEVLRTQLSNAREQLSIVKEESLQRLKEEKKEWEEVTRGMMAVQDRHHRESLVAQQHRFDETMAKVSAQVKSATDDMLRKRQQEFAESSHQNLGQIVTPLRETIDKMKDAMNDSALKQTKLTGELKANIEAMIRQSEAARRSAEELTRAFKHGSKVQGDWGERILGELLDSQGLTQGVHYDVQTYLRDAKGEIVTTDEGAKMRPDVILFLSHASRL